MQIVRNNCTANNSVFKLKITWQHNIDKINLITIIIIMGY